MGNGNMPKVQRKRPIICVSMASTYLDMMRKMVNDGHMHSISEVVEYCVKHTLPLLAEEQGLLQLASVPRLEAVINTEGIETEVWRSEA